jgi:hypothetical protein
MNLSAFCTVYTNLGVAPYKSGVDVSVQFQFHRQFVSIPSFIIVGESDFVFIEEEQRKRSTSPFSIMRKKSTKLFENNLNEN